MELRVLGPLDVVGPAGTVKVGGRKDRVVLAMLALEPGGTVSEDRLVEAVWGPSPPRTAAKSIQNSIVQLRKVLGGGADLVIETRPNGYRLASASGALDSVRAERLIELARAARRREANQEAADLYREAVALWRGPSFVDVADASFVAIPGAVRIEELRWSAVEELVETELGLGRHHELTGELEALVAAQPLRERLWCQLMLALYRSGRQGEALRAYQRARQVLVEQIGIEPGPELRRLEQAVLDHDPGLDLDDDAPPRPSSGGEVDVAGAGDRDFVGRQQELSRLLSGVEDGRRGRGKAFLVSGEPGIGKTRLVDEVASRAAAAGSRVVWGRGWDGGGAPAFWPWVQILRALLDELGADALHRLAGPRVGALAVLLPDLGPGDGRNDEGGTGEQARFALFDVVAKVLVRAADDVPLVLVLDDLHAVDRASLELLGFLCRGLRGTRITVMATYRDREVANDPAMAHLVGGLAREGEPLLLGGLDREAVHRILEHALGEGVSPSMGTTVCAATRGNPLFVTGLARLMASEPCLLDRQVPADRLPEGVRETIRQLLRPLSRQAHDLLAAAAVLGDSFTTTMLCRVTATPADVVNALLAEAAVTGLTEPTSEPGRHSFHHALVRETLYSQLSPEARRRLHAGIAAAIEEEHGSDVGPHAAQLAHHGVRAIDVLGAEKAVRYCTVAAHAAERVFAWHEAAGQYRLALSLCEEHAVAPVRRASLLDSLGDLLIDSGIDLAKGIEHLEEALGIYTGEGSQEEAAAWVHARLARARSSFIQTMDMPRALEHYREAEEALRGGPVTGKLGYLYAGYASATNTLLRTEDTIRAAGRGMEIADAIGEARLWNSAAVNHANSMMVAGRFREGLDELEQVWTASDREGFLVPAFMAVWYLAFWYTELGNPGQAKRWLSRELARPRQAAEGQNRTLLLHFLADAEALAGQMDEARRLLGSVPVVPTLALQRGTVAFLDGQWHHAWSLLDEYVRHARRVQNGVAETLGLLHLAPLLIAEDDCAGAVAACDKALDLLPKSMCNAPLSYTRMPLIRALVRAGALDRAGAEVDELRRLMTPEEDWQGLRGRAHLAEAEVAMARGCHQEAERHFDAAITVFHRFRLPWDEVTLLLDRAALRDRAGERAASVEDRARAGEVLRRIGARGRWTDDVRRDPSTPSPVADP